LRPKPSGLTAKGCKGAAPGARLTARAPGQEPARARLPPPPTPPLAPTVLPTVHPSVASSPPFPPAVPPLSPLPYRPAPASRRPPSPLDTGETSGRRCCGARWRGRSSATRPGGRRRGAGDTGEKVVALVASILTPACLTPHHASPPLSASPHCARRKRTGTRSRRAREANLLPVVLDLRHGEATPKVRRRESQTERSRG
jgi:hypothetical protein